MLQKTIRGDQLTHKHLLQMAAARRLMIYNGLAVLGAARIPARTQRVVIKDRNCGLRTHTMDRYGIGNGDH